MQYILSEEEYDDLVNSNKKIEFSKKKKLQEICTKVANKFAEENSVEYSPCIISTRSGYCDDCCVVDICPFEWKSFSQ